MPVENVTLLKGKPCERATRDDKERDSNYCEQD